MSQIAVALACGVCIVNGISLKPRCRADGWNAAAHGLAGGRRARRASTAEGQSGLQNGLHRAVSTSTSFSAASGDDSDASQSLSGFVDSNSDSDFSVVARNSNEDDSPGPSSRQSVNDRQSSAPNEGQSRVDISGDRDVQSSLQHAFQFYGRLGSAPNQAACSAESPGDRDASALRQRQFVGNRSGRAAARAAAGVRVPGARNCASYM